jgi:HSP20 family protein
MGRRNDRDNGRTRTPAVEIFEEPNTVMVRVEMPGVDKENFDIGIDNDELTIKGKRSPVDSGLRLLHGESDQNDYYRVFSLGDTLDASKVEADVDNGVLTLTFPKKPEILPKKIEIKVT